MILENPSPIISVVIPVYNGEQTIVDAVSSVLHQTFQDFELLVIDDGSEDTTIEVLSAINDRRMKVIPQLNSGPSASRNLGIQLAKGEYISFLDADDIWTSDKIEAQLDALLNNPEADISYSWTDYIDESGTQLGYGIHFTRNGFIFPELLTSNIIGNGSNALFRSIVFENADGFDKTIEPAEDWELFLRLAVNHQFIGVPKAQVLYRFSEDSLSANVLQMERASLQVINRVYSCEPGRSLQNLERLTKANLYFYLSDRVLKGRPSRQSGYFAARYLWLSLVHNPENIKQFYRVSTLIFKIATAIIFEPEQTIVFREKVKSLGKTLARYYSD